MLSVQNLYCSIGEKPILSDINFKIKEKEALCLFGKNGAGKSTLLKCIADLIYYNEGRITILDIGKDIRKKYFLSLGCFFSESALYNFLTLKENYHLFLAYYGLDKKSAELMVNEYAQAFELGEIINKKIKHLSSGQMQRASLALIFMHAPKMLLFDEPLNNLDVRFIDKFYEILENYIKKNKASALIVNHDIKSTPDWVQYIGVLDGGELLIQDNNIINLNVAYHTIINR